MFDSSPVAGIIILLASLAAGLLLLIILRALWMWLFGASEIVKELRALRAEVRALQSPQPQRQPPAATHVPGPNPMWQENERQVVKSAPTD